MARRRTFTSDFKAQVVLEDLTGVKSPAEICREHQLNPQVLARWKAEFVQRAPEIFATKQNDEAQERTAELERTSGD